MRYSYGLKMMTTKSSERRPGSSKSPAALHSQNRKLLFCIFSLVPVVVVVILVELTVRLVGLDQPKLQSPFLTQADDPVHQHDSQLLFALRPNIDAQMQGVRVVTNSDGLRCAEIGPKQAGELRILSLGESSTFGAMVESEQTYSALLEKQLQHSDESRKWRVINAGVSAYTSFQSLKFLELRGLKLKPDMVLFYHEMNDFLPATVRWGTSQDESSLALTDRELYESKRQWIYRKLLAISAVYRLIHYHQSRRSLLGRKKYLGDADESAALIPRDYYVVESREGVRLMNLPTRVLPEERKQNLEKLKAMCDAHNILLVIIHPSYRQSKSHECELTEFCESTQVPMFEAFHSLHPPQSDPNDWFLDLWHPSPNGHQAIAEDLIAFLSSSGLLPHYNAGLICQYLGM